MKPLRKAIIATFLSGSAVSCPQAQQQGNQQPNQASSPYAVQRDVLGESLNSFVANNRSCKPKAGEIDGSQTCVVTAQTTYAGMPVMGRTANFYQGRLYEIILIAPTSACKQFDLLNSLTQKFGKPKSTETVDGKEMTPAHLPGADFNIWQNGVSTITFSESMGTLDACTTDFALDTVYWKVWKLEEEKNARKEETKKKDM